MPLISVVTSLFYSARFVQPFCERMQRTIEHITDDYEIVFVNDGSPDNSSDIVCALHQKDKRICLVELSRNFGHAAAMRIGMEHARGEYVFAIDVDLEEPPELLTQFYNIMHHDKENIDVVFGVMEQRKGNLQERVLGALFYKFLNALSDIHVPENQVWARLMKRSYVNSLLRFQETHLYMAGVMTLTGYKQVACPVTKTSKGTTVYTFFRRVAQALDAILSFSIKPLTYISILGLCISVVGIAIGLYVVLSKLFYNQVMAGWTSLIASIWFIGGTTIAAIGVVGLYTAKMFIQVKQRPTAIARTVLPEELRKL